MAVPFAEGKWLVLGGQCDRFPYGQFMAWWEYRHPKIKNTAPKKMLNMAVLLYFFFFNLYPLRYFAACCLDMARKMLCKRVRLCGGGEGGNECSSAMSWKWISWHAFEFCFDTSHLVVYGYCLRIEVKSRERKKKERKVGGLAYQLSYRPSQLCRISWRGVQDHPHEHHTQSSHRRLASWFLHQSPCKKNKRVLMRLPRTYMQVQSTI